MVSLKNVKTFLSVLNADALLFLGVRLASIVLSITSVILMCRAVTIQQYFLTDGLGLMYDMMPLGPLAYSLVWSVVSLILPGCQRKYRPVLDMGFDSFGLAASIAAGIALLMWSFVDSYELELCRDILEQECLDAGISLSSTEKSSAVLLLFIGLTHLIMFIRASRAVWIRRKQYVPSRDSFMMLEPKKPIMNRRSRLASIDLNTVSITDTQPSEKGEEVNEIKSPSIGVHHDSPV